MKRILTTLSSFGLITTIGASVVACKNDNSTLLSKKVENTDSNKEKEKAEEIKKLKSQISVLEGEQNRAKKILGDIQKGIDTVNKLPKEQKDKQEKNLETLNREKQKVEKELETAKITKEDLEAKLKLLENNNS
ncbi:lipoprotein (VlcE) [Mycoplasma feriruminatoris]|uniref:lipoprotein n=1 Tax=Mycoplasma feriruminatoris TaxID=1179777 RepID=UPI00241C672B|nr:lipoprotein [Mycoplasma feriruminatoris]WFQ90950.1 lipoprotein (VlcE) [Mycoplasma feriruminatoris]